MGELFISEAAFSSIVYHSFFRFHCSYRPAGPGLVVFDSIPEVIQQHEQEGRIAVLWCNEKKWMTEMMSSGHALTEL